MPEEHNDKIEERLRDVFHNSGKQHPPEDFTSRVMDRIENQPSSIRFSYEPIISRRGWIVISILVLFLILYIFMLSGSPSLDGRLGPIFENLDLHWLTSWIPNLGSEVFSIKWSGEVTFSILAILTLGILEILLRMNLRLKR